MRISDWSSDVCSSDLVLAFQQDAAATDRQRAEPHHGRRRDRLARTALADQADDLAGHHVEAEAAHGMGAVATLRQGDAEVADAEYRRLVEGFVHGLRPPAAFSKSEEGRVGKRGCR